jgi:hypothetical protein
MAKEPQKDNRSVVDIDELLLDKEWAMQPRLVLKWSAKLAEARKELAEAKADFEIVKADLGVDIRKNPAGYGMVKTTDNSVKECLVRQPQYSRALQQVIDAQYEVDLLEGVTDALEHRKFALNNLVTLQGREFFSVPNGNGVGTELVKKAHRDRAFMPPAKRREAEEKDHEDDPDDA